MASSSPEWNDPKAQLKWPRWWCYVWGEAQENPKRGSGGAARGVVRGARHSDLPAGHRGRALPLSQAAAEPAPGSGLLQTLPRRQPHGVSPGPRWAARGGGELCSAAAAQPALASGGFHGQNAQRLGCLGVLVPLTASWIYPPVLKAPWLHPPLPALTGS